MRLPRAESRRDAREGLAILRRAKWSILAITLLIVGLGLFISSQQEPVYESTTRVLIDPIDAAGDDGENVEPNLSTEAELVSSVAVAQIVKENLDLPGSPRVLLEHLRVGRPVDTEILEISYRDPGPTRASRLAQGFAEGYIEYRRESISQDVSDAATALEQELDVLSARLRQIQNTLATIGQNDPLQTTLQSEASLLQQRILDAEVDLLALPDRVSVGRIVEPAGMPTSPVSPNHVVSGALGLTIGLALAIGVAFLRDRFSGRLRSSDEIEDHLGAPVLGAIPQVGTWRRRKEEFLVSVRNRRSPAAEAYRILRTNVLTAASTAGAKSIVVTSPYSGEGKSATVANLGVVIARAGKRVSLVSADLRRPRLHRFFSANGRYGLTEVLIEVVSLADAIQEVRPSASPTLDGVRLRILPSGSIPEDPAELLTSDNLEKVVRKLEESSDIVLIDAPPMLPVTDALVVGQIAQGVLVVFGPRSVNQQSALSARQQLEMAGVRVLGCVLNGPDPRLTQDSFYGY